MADEAKGEEEAKGAAPPPRRPTGTNGGRGRHTHAFAELVNKLNMLDQLNKALAREGHGVDLPHIVMCGAQSAGKSSVLQAIVGHSFVPTGDNMVTRVPLHLELHTISAADHERDSAPYACFNNSSKKVRDMETVASKIGALTDKLVPREDDVGTEPITVRFYSKDLPQLSLVDLPGLIQVNNARQAENLPRRIEALVRSYVEKEHTIILAVAPANVPLMNSPAMRLAKEVDAAGLRTIGVLTKVDTLKQSDDQRDLKAAVVNCVTNNGQGGAYPLRTHGYVAVMTNPLYGSGAGRQRTFRGLRALEDEYFSRAGGYLTEFKAQCGIPYLSTKLQVILGREIERRLPGVHDQLKIRMAGVEKELNVLDKQVSRGEQHQLLVDAATDAQQWFGMNVDGEIKARPGKQQMDLTHQLLLEELQELFRDYRKQLDDALKAIDRDALRNSIVAMLARKRGCVERQVIDLLCLSVVKGLKYPTMVLLAKCAVKIHEQLQSIKTPLQTRCPPAHNKLINMITRGFEDQIEECVEFVNNFLRLEVFIANRRHPEFRKVARGMRGEARDPEMTEKERVVAQFVRPRWSNSEFCYVKGCHRHLRWGLGARHHCRSCGLTVCGPHSSDEDARELLFELEKHRGPERVCQACHAKWTAIQLVESRANDSDPVTSTVDIVKSPGVFLGRRGDAEQPASAMELPTRGMDGDEAKQGGDNGAAERKVNAAAAMAPLVVVEPKPVNPLEIRPPRKMRKVLCDQRDEQLVATLVDGAMFYGQLMKEKLGHHIPKVLQFMLLEKSRDTVFAGLMLRLRDKEVRRDFADYMDPALAKLRAKYDALQKRMQTYEEMEQVLFSSNRFRDQKAKRDARNRARRSG